MIFYSIMIPHSSEDASMKLLMLNGPNLNLTGIREPEIYGTQTLSEIEDECRALAKRGGAELDCLQTNHEGALIDALHAAMGAYTGVVLNPGALAHYSYALRDAIAACGLPVIEVHMSDIYSREPFRRDSVIAPVCAGQIVGQGGRGYLMAIEAFLDEERNV